MSETFEYTEYFDGEGSSAIHKVLWNEVTRKMLVFFPNRDIPAGYSEVDRNSYEGFRDAASLGRYYGENIRGYWKGFTTVDITDVRYVHLPSYPEPGPGQMEIEHYSPADLETYEVTYTHTTTTRVQATSFEDAISSVTDTDDGVIKVLGVKIVE